MWSRPLPRSCTGTLDLAQTIIESDHQINELEVDTEEMCLRVIALRQPAGRDLRFISTAMKIITTLERMGDLATNIASGLLRWWKNLAAASVFTCPLWPKPPRNWSTAPWRPLSMKTLNWPFRVCRDDTYVNDTYKKVIEELLNMMGEKSILIPRAMKIMFVAKVPGTDCRSCRSYVRDGGFYGGRKNHPPSAKDPGLSG